MKWILCCCIIILISSCTESNKKNNVVKNDNSTKVENVVINNEDGPPFSDSCLCKFNILGEVKTLPNQLDVIISGKGWNPLFYSCNYIWGELINNQVPSDSTISDLRIHLVDIDKVEGGVDSRFLNSNIFKSNIIVTYSKTANSEIRVCTFDPNKTGKYTKPEIWEE